MIPALSVLGSILGSATSVASMEVTPAQAPAAVGPSFGKVLADVATQAVDDLKGGEASAISGLQGKATVQQVVESVMSAEQSLTTALAIRDKAVSAYQALSQMAI